MVNSLAVMISVADTQLINGRFSNTYLPFRWNWDSWEDLKPELKLEQVKQTQQYSPPDCREKLSAVTAY